MRNQLKSNLLAGKTYCVKFFVNIGENSAFSIDKIGAYFGGSELDTIVKGQTALTYLSPQIENPPNVFPTDTIGWTLITGTFTAIGNEKYMVVSNFRSNQATNTVSISPNPAVQQWSACTIALDDVSCIPIDLPAFAGHDTTCIPGTSVYLGRARDVGIDEACTWYKLPVSITPTTPAIDTAAGIWVSPTETSTYVVRQEICGVVKLDTVIVYKDAVGIGEKSITEIFSIEPNPAQENFFLVVGERSREVLLELSDLQGRVVMKEKLVLSGSRTAVPLDDLQDGVYFVRLQDKQGRGEIKKLVIQR